MIHANKQQNHARRRPGLVLALVALISAASLATGLIRPASAQADARSWSVTGSLNTPRYFHTSTLLPDGKVLVAGGSDIAELYDPVTGTWSVTGRLNVPRALHTATLLRDGKVLIVGGFGNDSNLDSAELYDPQTGTWSLTGNLHTPRYFHTATLLKNGKVLVAGGDDGKGGEFYSPLNTAELYDPDAGTWSFTGNLNGALEEHTATLLQDGRALVTGGCCGNNRAQLYDPDTESWSTVTGLGYPLFGHSTTLLSDGRVLLVGGTIIGSGWLRNDAELYDPNARRWSSTGHLNTARINHTATLLPDGKVLVAGGAGGLRGGSLVSSELYDPVTGTWSFTDNLNTPRSHHTATLLPDGKVLIVGGLRSSAGNTSSLDSVELGHNFPAVATPAPYISNASVGGRKLRVNGENFAPGAVILINGEEQKTKNYILYPDATLIGKKAGEKIKPGDRLQVRNPDGTLSGEFIFTGS